ncbi:hypothetical protein KC328_g18373, partial [Hortaea werneckii]
GMKKRGKRPVKNLSPRSEDGDQQSQGSESEFGDAQSESTGYLHPSKRGSLMPPTPDLVHDRSSTSMSLGSESTAATPQRHSLQSHYKTQEEDIPEVPTRIMEHEGVGEFGPEESSEPVTKFSPRGLEHRRSQPFGQHRHSAQ